MTDIKGFRDEYKWLSNMYRFDPIIIQGYKVISSENYYQAMKTLDEDERQIICNLTPHESKRYCKDITLRGDWDEIKDRVMWKALQHKFHKNAWLKNKLVETGDCYIEETNYWNDTYWGVCKGVGENRLGKMLMKLREGLK